MHHTVTPRLTWFDSSSDDVMQCVLLCWGKHVKGCCLLVRVTGLYSESQVGIDASSVQLPRKRKVCMPGCRLSTRRLQQQQQQPGVSVTVLARLSIGSHCQINMLWH